MSKKIKDIVASVKGRLLEVARKEGKRHQLLLTRYFQERFLYRLSISDYANHFCLKGGALLYAFSGEKSRPTKDIDLLGLHVSNNLQEIAAIVKHICSIDHEEDGVNFDVNSIEVSEIVKEDKYKGVRVKMMAYLKNTRQTLQIDFGFGDRIVPAPIQMNYPTILTLPAPIIIAYSKESVIAEKFEAMIDLAESNSRMKDFYDVFHLLKFHTLDFEVLPKAIYQTFTQRKTPYIANHSLFEAEFALDKFRQQQWKAFLKKSHLDTSIDFQLVLAEIKAKLLPIYKELRRD